MEGKVRVAKYYPGKPLPTTPGYRNVLIHTSPDGLGGGLSPYVLRNEQGHLLENIWQFSKVYGVVEAQKIPLSRKFHPTKIIWEHPREIHLDPKTRLLTPEYWAWRKKGMNNPWAVRYPNGYRGRHNCLCSVWVEQNSQEVKILDYISARKIIYCGEYARLAPRTSQFQRLLQLLRTGENLQIIEVDGPDPELDFPPYDEISIDNPGLLITEEKIRLLLEDPRKPFGHGYTIAALLLGGKSWLE